MRVIAGEFGGRRLQAPHGSRTRPTSDRVREALFMKLEPLAAARVVDLYAGSGALGIEALSRGAAFAHFVESDRHALEALRANLGALELGDRARVWPLRLPGAVGRLAEALANATRVRADPPYGGAEAGRLPIRFFPRYSTARKVHKKRQSVNLVLQCRHGYPPELNLSRRASSWAPSV
mgnify:CR=1 FL=1